MKKIINRGLVQIGLLLAYITGFADLFKKEDFVKSIAVGHPYATLCIFIVYPAFVEAVWYEDKDKNEEEMRKLINNLVKNNLTQSASKKRKGKR